MSLQNKMQVYQLMQSQNQNEKDWTIKKFQGTNITLQNKRLKTLRKPSKTKQTVFHTEGHPEYQE